MNQNCSKCGAETIYKTGISQKTGKKWEGYKCGACNNMDFIKSKPSYHQELPKIPRGDNKEALDWAKDLSIAIVKKCETLPSNVEISSILEYWIDYYKNRITM